MGFGGSPPRDKRSVRSTRWVWMARCSSRSDVKTSVRLSAVVTFQKSSLKSASCRRILNLCPQLVHLTVVPRPLTSASSNSYSVLQRSHLTSIATETREGLVVGQDPNGQRRALRRTGFDAGNEIGRAHV